MSALRVRQLGANRYVVVDASGQICGGVRRSAKAALAAAEAVQRRAARRSRACLCCGHRFLSDGAHNRMCGTCRAGGGASPFEDALSIALSITTVGL